MTFLFYWLYFFLSLFDVVVLIDKEIFDYIIQMDDRKL